LWQAGPPPNPTPPSGFRLVVLDKRVSRDNAALCSEVLNAIAPKGTAEIDEQRDVRYPFLLDDVLAEPLDMADAEFDRLRGLPRSRSSRITSAS
jgi:hypothetical protein